MAGVEKVDVDFPNKMATVKMKAGKSLDAEAMTKALKAQGYVAAIKG